MGRMTEGGGWVLLGVRGCRGGERTQDLGRVGLGDGCGAWWGTTTKGSVVIETGVGHEGELLSATGLVIHTTMGKWVVRLYDGFAGPAKV